MTEVTAVPLRPIKKGALATLWIGVAALVVIAGGVAWAGTRGAVVAAMTPAEFLAYNSHQSGVKTTSSGLQYKVLDEGKGAKPTASDIAMVEYDGRLASTGKSFDSTAAHGGQAVPMPVGQVIPGFSEGLQLMPSGSKYRFWIKPELGYGDQEKRDPMTGEVAIPANSVLVFDVTLAGVLPAQAMGMMPGAPVPPHGGM